jgi:Haem-NO-binding
MERLMKGVVFNLLERVVVNKYGEATWDDLLEVTQLSGIYTTLGSYPDEEIQRLVVAASAALNISERDVLRWFGREAMPLLADQYPAFFSPHQNAGSFIKSVNAIIHPEVRKLYAGAGCPHFNFDQAENGSFVMGYNSPRKLCSLAQGFMEGAGDHYGNSVLVEHVLCMHRGDSNCSMSIRVQ